MQMLDRTVFVNSIDLMDISIEDCILKHFDELMALYDIMYTYKDFNIYGSMDDSVIVFKIESDNPSIDKIKSIIHNTTITKYNKTLVCTAQKDNNHLNIILK